MTAQREWLDEDYYKVLGVSKDATAKDLKTKYRELSRKFHPDTNQGDSDAEERFKEISAAYDVIGNEAKRKEYDEVRSMASRPGPRDGGHGGQPSAGYGGGFNYDSNGFNDINDLGDLFGDLFGNGGGPSGFGGGYGQGPQRAREGADLETGFDLSFRDAVRGLTTSFHLTSGNGSDQESREIRVRIPAGVKDGSRIKVAKRGGPGINGGPPGDLYLVVAVAADTTFGRKGNHLTLTVPVTFAEAALGGTIEVPTLDDGTKTIKIPAGTASGKKFRVKGQGVKTSKSTGDLLVEVKIVVPTDLSASQREAIEVLQQELPDNPRTHLKAA